MVASYITFGAPDLLLFLVAIPLAGWAFIWLERRRARSAQSWTSPHLVPNLVPARPGLRRYVPFALFLVGLALLLVGFARPQADLRTVKEGATVVLAIDTSGSMASTDVKPSRIGAADAALTSFAEHLPSKYRLALVQFSSTPSVRMPPTYDHEAVVKVLPTKTQEQGTAIGDAIELAIKVAKTAVGPNKPGDPHPPAAILLLSDGTQNAGKVAYATAAAAARKADIPISTVALGTDHGSVSQPLGQGATNVQQVPVDPSALKQIASASGGRFYAATSADALEQVYKDMGSRLVTTRKAHEVTDRVTGAALALMVAGTLLSTLWFRRVI